MTFRKKLLWFLVGFLAVLLAGSLLQAHFARNREAERLVEAEALRQEGYLVATRESQAKLDQAAREIKLLKGQVERVLAVKTEKVVVKSDGACVIPPGSEVAFDVTVGEARTAKGNLVVGGRVAARRVTPGPEIVFAEAPFSSALSQVMENTPAREQRQWAAHAGFNVLDRGVYVGIERHIRGPAWLTSTLHADEHVGFGLTFGVRWEF